MCCLFGFIDYAGALSVTQKSRLIRELSIAAEVRGTDATGIAYNSVGFKSTSVRWRRIGCICVFLRKHMSSWDTRV